MKIGRGERIIRPKSEEIRPKKCHEDLHYLYSSHFLKYVSILVIKNCGENVNGRRTEFCMGTIKIRVLLEYYCYGSEVLCVCVCLRPHVLCVHRSKYVQYVST